MSTAHEPSTNLSYVEFQLLGGNAEHRSHKATGHIYRHDVLVTAFETHNGKAAKTLLYNLGGQEAMRLFTLNLETDEMRILCAWLSHLRGV